MVKYNKITFPDANALGPMSYSIFIYDTVV